MSEFEKTGTPMLGVVGAVLGASVPYLGQMLGAMSPSKTFGGAVELPGIGINPMRGLEDQVRDMSMQAALKEAELTEALCAANMDKIGTHGCVNIRRDASNVPKPGDKSPLSSIEQVVTIALVPHYNLQTEPPITLEAIAAQGWPHVTIAHKWDFSKKYPYWPEVTGETPDGYNDPGSAFGPERL